MLVAVVLVVIAVGTVVFHVVSPWWWTPIASNWHIIDDATLVTFWITGIAYVAVILFMAYCAVRFRYRKGRRAAYEPENKRLEWWLTGLTSLGVIGLLTPGLIAWNEFVTVPDDAVEFEVVGRQWQWSYRLPGEDGVLGASDPLLITGDNTFGLDPNDPRGQDDVLIEGDNLHLPIGRPLKVLMRSVDVIHDFYVPNFRAKMDIIPGMVTYFWFTPTRTGTFDILCAELCGLGHHTMRGMVVVEEESDYQGWLQGQSTFAELAAARGRAVKLAAGEGPQEAAPSQPNPVTR